MYNRRRYSRCRSDSGDSRLRTRLNTFSVLSREPTLSTTRWAISSGICSSPSPCRKERTCDLLHHAVQPEALELSHRFVARRNIEDPEQMLPRHRQRGGLSAVDQVEALLPGFPVVPLRAPRYAAGEALLECGRARGVIAAETDGHHADALRVDLGPTRRDSRKPRWHSAPFRDAGRARESVGSSPLPGPSTNEARDSRARQDPELPFEILDLLRHVETVEGHHRRPGPLRPLHGLGMNE